MGMSVAERTIEIDRLGRRVARAVQADSLMERARQRQQ
jgi:hypothetical protein